MLNKMIYNFQKIFVTNADKRMISMYCWFATTVNKNVVTHIVFNLS